MPLNTFIAELLHIILFAFGLIVDHSFSDILWSSYLKKSARLRGYYCSRCVIRREAAMWSTYHSLCDLFHSHFVIFTKLLYWKMNWIGYLWRACQCSYRHACCWWVRSKASSLSSSSASSETSCFLIAIITARDVARWPVSPFLISNYIIIFSSSQVFFHRLIDKFIPFCFYLNLLKKDNRCAGRYNKL